MLSVFVAPPVFPVELPAKLMTYAYTITPAAIAMRIKSRVAMIGLMALFCLRHFSLFITCQLPHAIAFALAVEVPPSGLTIFAVTESPDEGAVVPTGHVAPPLVQVNVEPGATPAEMEQVAEPEVPAVMSVK